MSNWIDYNMLASEIGLHIGNAKLDLQNYRDLKKERKLSESEMILYGECIGKLNILQVLQQWCNDFNFSSEDVAKFFKEEFEK